MKYIEGDKKIGIITHMYMELSQENSLCSYHHLEKTKHVMFSLLCLLSFILQNQRTGVYIRSCPEGRLARCQGLGFRERGLEHAYGANKCAHMYGDPKMIPVEIIPGIGRERGREGGREGRDWGRRVVEAVYSCMVYLIHFKNFLNVIIYPHSAQV
jgi:hypothetical protein